MLCDTIRYVSQPCPTKPFEIISTARSWAIDLAVKDSEVPLHDFWNIFARTLCGDVLEERFPDGFIPSLKDWTSDIQDCLLRGHDLTGQCLAHWQGMATNTLSEHLLVTTEDGRIGLAPLGTLQGELLKMLQML